MTPRCSLPAAAAPLWAVLVALLLSLAGCGGEQDTANARTSRPSRDHLVTAFEAAREAVTLHHERPGSLRFRRLVRIFSQEEGRIDELEVFEGDRVDRGERLVRLEDDLLRAELDKARATTAQEQLDLERQEKLGAQGAVSEDELAQARTALAVAQAEERLLETRLAFTRIRAPFSGVITERFVEPGDFVTKNTHLLTLADPASLVAEVYASELILPLVGLGDPVDIRIDALGSEVFSGRVLRIHPALSRVNRQAAVEVALEPVPAGARAGQFVRATLRTAAVDRIVVPFRAVRRDRDGQFLWLVNDDAKVERRRVRTGLRVTDRVEILDGLAPGEQVVTRGFLGLSEGQAVRVVDAEG